MERYDVTQWLRARHLVSQIQAQPLEKNMHKIASCVGGFKRCLKMLLNDPSILSTKQLQTLTKLLTNINSTTSITRAQDIDNNQRTVASLPSCCLHYVTSFLSMTDITSFNHVCSKFAVAGLNEIKKTSCYVLDGHTLVAPRNFAKYRNMAQLGGSAVLVHKRVYKDNNLMTVLQGLAELACSSGSLSKWQNIMIRAYVQDTHRRLYVVQKLLCRRKSKNVYTDTLLVRKLNAEVAIGQVLKRYRTFLLLDRTKIHVLPLRLSQKNVVSKSDKRNGSKVLCCIKYFDVFSQSTFFVDWVFIIQNLCTVQHIEDHVINKLLTDKTRHYFDTLQSHLLKMDVIQKQETSKLVWFQELAIGQIEKRLPLDKMLNKQCRHVDIFVFQVNTEHAYFEMNRLPMSFKASFGQSNISMHTSFVDFAKSANYVN